MGYKVRWTESAVADAEQYAEYIARDSQTYAARFTADIREQARSLSQMPERGRRVPVIERDDIRELISGNYRLIYQLTSDTVFIIAVEHGAQLLDVDDLREKLK